MLSDAAKRSVRYVGGLKSYPSQQSSGVFMWMKPFPAYRHVSFGKVIELA